VDYLLEDWAEVSAGSMNSASASIEVMSDGHAAT
jgi:hypothetical protein